MRLIGFVVMFNSIMFGAQASESDPPKVAVGGALHAAPFPKDYRSWTHVKSMAIVDPKHPLFGAFGGIHHIYANPSAEMSLKNKGDFPKGAAFAFDLLEANEAGGSYTEGKRKFVAVMYRDAKKFSDANGWSWQVYEEGDPKRPSLTSRDAQKACASCHTEVGAKHFVFTEWRP